MKRHIAPLLIATALGPVANVQAARIVPARVHLSVRPEFPIRRALPDVLVRPAQRGRVAPRGYLAPLAFGATIVASMPRASRQVWQATDTLSSGEGWTDFTMNVGRRGKRLYLDIDRGTAQFSFAEVVYDNGQSQVIDFNDRTQGAGLYSLLDVAAGRTIDYVRMVAKADTRTANITVRLTT